MLGKIFKKVIDVSVLRQDYLFLDTNYSLILQKDNTNKNLNYNFFLEQEHLNAFCVLFQIC
jgi:hypothetical protein